MTSRLTVFIPAGNEEANLGACLDSLKWAEDILVIDSLSTDRTVETARAKGARVLEHEYGYSAKQKNWGLDQIEAEWVLIVDADERIPKALAEEIQNVVRENGPVNGYWISRDAFLYGKKVRAWSRDTVLRLFRTKRGRYEDKLVHAEIILEGKRGSLHTPMEHHSFRNFEQYLPKLIRYSRWSAEDAHRRGKRSNLYHILTYPPADAAKRLFLKGGLLDGTRGFIIAGLTAVSTFLKYARMWELQNKFDSPRTDVKSKD